MSKTALALLLGVAVALGIGLWIASQSPSAPSNQQQTPALEITPADVLGIAIRTNGSAHDLARERGGAWSYAGWPVNPEGPSRALRALDALARAEPFDGDAGGGLEITLRMHGGEAHTIVFDTQPIAGMIGASVDGGDAVRVPSTITDAFANPGSWRLRGAFPGVRASEASRIVISDAEGATLEFAKLDSRWRLRRPFPARVNATALQALSGLLDSLVVQQFLDDPPPASTTQLGQPRLTLRIERDVRTAAPDGSVSTRVASVGLRVGGLEATGQAAFAASDVAPDKVITVPASFATSVSTAVRSYLALTACDIPEEDIAILRVVWRDGTEAGYRRDLGTWQTLPDKQPVDIESIRDAIAFLTEEPGEPQETLGDNDIRSVARVELFDFKADPLERLRIGYTADGTVAVRGQNVLWLYDRPAPAIFRVPPFESLAPEEQRTAPPPPEDDAPSK
ncbi:MAG: hypothetical protein AAFX05_03850 [Planctomycetota bacterium]